jgi:hypothetical protein
MPGGKDGGGIYMEEIGRARADRQGLHRMTFETPEAYRRRQRSGDG